MVAAALSVTHFYINKEAYKLMSKQEKNNAIVSERERGLGVKFCRLRRITGYITGSLDTWNTAKLRELNDRVTHM